MTPMRPRNSSMNVKRSFLSGRRRGRRPGGVGAGGARRFLLGDHVAPGDQSMIEVAHDAQRPRCCPGCRDRTSRAPRCGNPGCRSTSCRRGRCAAVPLSADRPGRARRRCSGRRTSPSTTRARCRACRTGHRRWASCRRRRGCRRRRWRSTSRRAASTGSTLQKRAVMAPPAKAVVVPARQRYSHSASVGRRQPSASRFQVTDVAVDGVAGRQAVGERNARCSRRRPRARSRCPRGGSAPTKVDGLLPAGITASHWAWVTSVARASIGRLSTTKCATSSPPRPISSAGLPIAEVGAGRRAGQDRGLGDGHARAR